MSNSEDAKLWLIVCAALVLIVALVMTGIVLNANDIVGSRCFGEWR